MESEINLISMTGGIVLVEPNGTMHSAERYGPEPALDVLQPGLKIIKAWVTNENQTFGPPKMAVLKKRTEPNCDVPDVYDAYLMVLCRVSTDGTAIIIEQSPHPREAGYAKKGTNIQCKGIGGPYAFVVLEDSDYTL